MDVESALQLLNSLQETQVDSSSLPKKRGKYASRACDACKKNHFKCDGNTPQCSHCAKSGAQCSWDLAPSKRGRKRKTAPLEVDQFTSVHQDDLQTDLLVAHTAPKARRTLISVPADASLNKNHGHFAFIVGAYYNRLRLFLDLPSSVTFVHHSDMWSNFTSRSTGNTEMTKLNHMDIESLIYRLEYAAAGLVGCLNSSQLELQRTFSKAAEAVLDEALNERELHLWPAFAPFADRVVSAMLSLCYHYCFFSRFNKWRQLALQAWDVAQRFPTEIRPQTRQTLLAMLLGTEHDANARQRWQELCLASPTDNASSLMQTSMWLSLSTFLPARFSHTFVWNKKFLTNLIQPTSQTASTLYSTSLAARASIETVLDTHAGQSDVISATSAWRIILAASDVLRLFASHDVAAATQLAMTSLRTTLDSIRPDAHGFIPTLPFYTCTGVLICALASVHLDRDLAARAARELQRIGTPKTTSLASEILSEMAEDSTTAMGAFDWDVSPSATASDSPSASLSPTFSVDSPIIGLQTDSLESLLGISDDLGPQVTLLDFADG
eukprot:TRINITY_DN6656_c0_g1_i1.p1 TRINITY_DN6656_c0_g1~~TRINITY_DN6656_c0_g1_i1.p1  ORF type:complete len:553 (-),score=57.86 TRINITY_DN6656_c0_g1_i1:417-2075(-)